MRHGPTDSPDRSVLVPAARETTDARTAVLLDGRVSAPQVTEPPTSGQITRACGSAAEAREVDDRRHATQAVDSQ